MSLNTGLNTSAFVYQQPTTDQMALANGNRHGRQKQDGGNKKEGGQEWLGDKSRWLCSPCGLRLENLVKNTCDFDSIIKLNSTVCKLVEIVKGVVDDNVILNKKIDEVIETTNNLVDVSQHSKKYRPDVDVCSVKKKNNVVDSNVILSQAYERSTTQTAECKTAEQEDQDQTMSSNL
ncbi:hypothetical protein J6590_092118 [Homalodisca vitripennis]|nr:hypothetical protein J6590_092118 [Homalodisca vitripennis]